MPKEEKAEEKKLPPGKKLYDIWRGKWSPVKTMKSPTGHGDIVLKWKFVRDGEKPVKTGIPLEDNHYKRFNDDRHIQMQGIVTEQLFPHGATTDIFHELPNPFQITEIE